LLDYGYPAYSWRDHSRYAEIIPVQTGWMVVWGRYEQNGRARVTIGQRVYRDLAGVSRRLAEAVIELTGNRQEALDALALLEKRGLPEHAPATIG
jgi:hypothetical protein